MQTALLLDDPAAHGIALAAGALVHAHEGLADLARAEAAESLRRFQELGWAVGTLWPLWAIGITELSTGNPAAVDDALGPVSAMLTSRGDGDPFLGVFLPDEIEALVELGNLDRAEPLVRWLEERSAALDRPWARAAAGRCRGLLHAARGDIDGARRLWKVPLRNTIAAPCRSNERVPCWYSGVSSAAAARARSGEVMLDEALIAFQQLSTPWWSSKARREISSVSGRARGFSRRA